jgi:hypothetical protein
VRRAISYFTLLLDRSFRFASVLCGGGGDFCVQDKNGKMDIGELFGALNEMGLKLERRDLKAIMEACDIDVRHVVERERDDGCLHVNSITYKNW